MRQVRHHVAVVVVVGGQGARTITTVLAETTPVDVARD